jgi:flagellar biosynthetic protein FliQ
MRAWRVEGEACPPSDQRDRIKTAMNPDVAIDLGREAVHMALVLGSPVLVAGLVVGLIVGLLQAITQIHEQTVSFVPKLVVMVLVLSVALPWLVNEMVQYSHDVIQNIPQTL